MARFRELKVWQRAMRFTIRVYGETAEVPKSEMFGLTSQLRRAAVAVPLNIAEGSGSGSDLEFRRFLRIAQRSCYEVISGVEIGRGLNYVTDKAADELGQEAEEIAAMIGGVIRYLSQPKSQRKRASNPDRLTTDV